MKKVADDPYPVALRLLASRDYTVAAISSKLLARGCDEQQIQQAVERLVSERFLDDQRYLERFVEVAQNSGRYVGYRLRQELRRRGIAPELIDSVLAEKQDAAQEYYVARNLVARRYADFNPACGSDQERRRIAGFLQRRGFASDIIWKVLDRQNRFDDF